MRVLIIVAVLLLLTGCADDLTFAEAAKVEPVGFLHGFWHGLIIFFSFIGSLFSDDIAIYAIYNTGGWYDFGYLWGLGLSGFFATNSKR